MEQQIGFLSYKKEAELLCAYLTGKTLTEQCLQNYAAAVEINQIQLNGSEEKWWRLALRNRFFLRCVDAGLALTKPQSQVRQKIFIMLAVLESSPDYTDQFLPKQFSFFKSVFVFYSGCRAVFSALVGVLLVKLIK